MLVTFFRTLIVYVVLIVLMRLMGKRQIGEMQPFELVVTLIIADIACIPLADVSIPLIYGISAIVCLFILHQLLSILEQSGSFVKKIISGKPSIVINKKGVDLTELKKNNLGVDDLIESMRASGYFSFDDLSYAIYESNGKLSALENPDKPSPTNSLSLLIISDGKMSERNCRLIGKTKNDISLFLAQKNAPLKRVEVMTVDGNGRVYLKEKNKKFNIFNIPLKEDCIW